MEVIEVIPEMHKRATVLQLQRKAIGFVPTMGALHAGHVRQIEASNKYADVTVVSIFLNPAQFTPNDDLINYPSNLENDLKLCGTEGVDIVFTPQVNAMYPVDYSTYVQEELVSKQLGGPIRPLFFRGFATVITIFLNIIRPDFLILGQKDVQQTCLIRKVVKDLHMPVDIVIVPTVRESDGLACSATNQRLDKTQRAQVIKVYESMVKAKQMVENGTRSVERIVAEVTQILSKQLKIRINYVAIVDAETLTPMPVIQTGKSLLTISIWCDNIRLNDNILL